MNTTAEIRKGFLDFFASKKHQVIDSSSLVPEKDATLLFTNAGMNQFKDVFLGSEKRNYSRATTAQRCVRAGGKHNDLDNVGYTARHHTFFEMLGNFSFGDYFKKEAISYAWEFLTSKEYLNLPAEKLWVTVYVDDDEAFNVWYNIIGLTEDRIIRIGDKKGIKYNSDNFWQMGDTGPCGPCTEIFYDHGDHIWGGLPGSPEEDGDRYIEIWNLVFMQFNRFVDGSMQPLPKPSVDTGMGLERISAVLQHVNSNYEIDIFQILIKKIATILNVTDLEHKSLRVIADHIRSCSYLIADGVIPSNEGRGYVLRRIIRRAVRHGKSLGAKETFFYKIVPTLIVVMAEAGKILQEKQAQIEKLLKIEEELFNKTLERGLVILEDAIKQVKNKNLDGKIAFRLYDTYGFPLDLTSDFCREHNISVNEDEFNQEMEIQRKKAQASNKFSVDYGKIVKVETKTNYVGREKTKEYGKITAIIHDNKQVEKLVAGQEAIIILDTTPFFAEMGGQIGDTGTLILADNKFLVQDTQKYGLAYGHIGKLDNGSLVVGDVVFAEIDEERRNKISLNHSGTHLLHAALRKIIGPHAEQRGSLVADNILRFDFANFEALTIEQLNEIENYINHQIRCNYESTTEIVDLETAIKRGAIALFGSRYENKEQVRMVTTGPDSIELCGGVHVHNTGEIGFFKIIAEYGISAGIRRIEALTGESAIKWAQQQLQITTNIATLFKTEINTGLVDKIQALQEKNKTLEKEISILKEKLVKQSAADFSKDLLTINNTKVLVKFMDGAEISALRTLVDDIKNQIVTGVVVIGSIVNNKPLLVVGVTKNLTNQVKANELINLIAIDIDGKGGGRPDMATAGGTNSAGLQNALAKVKDILIEKLNG